MLATGSESGNSRVARPPLACNAAVYPQISRSFAPRFAPSRARTRRLPPAAVHAPRTPARVGRNCFSVAGDTRTEMMREACLGAASLAPGGATNADGFIEAVGSRRRHRGGEVREKVGGRRHPAPTNTPAQELRDRPRPIAWSHRLDDRHRQTQCCQDGQAVQQRRGEGQPGRRRGRPRVARHAGRAAGGDAG